MSGFPRLDPLGLDGWLVRFSDQLTEAANCAAIAFQAAVRAADWPAVVDVAGAHTSAHIQYDSGAPEAGAVRAKIEALLASRDWYAAPLPSGRRRWHIPASFEGVNAPQLSAAAAQAGVSVETAISDLTATPLRVQTIGFAPGQPYLGTLPPHWDVPRQTQMTPQVPKGALVVAIRQMVMFAVPTQTGWQQVGRVAFDPFQPLAPEPFLLRPGDEVALHAVSATELADLFVAPYGGARSEEISDAESASQ